MKEAFDWDEDYILNLPQGEHDWLEFKSSRLLDLTIAGVNQNDVTNELSKQLSAFANSGGGKIVYGVEDTPIGTPRTVDADGGVSLIVKNGTKEWLEDIIPNLVDFQLRSFNLYVITAKDATSGIAANKGLFVVDIPSSDSAPHQAKDKKYYARVSGKSQPINHRFVMDIIGRAKYPKLKMTCSLTTEDDKAGYRKSKDILRFFCKNTGKIYANYVSGYFYVPEEIVQSFNDNVVTLNGKKYIKEWFDNTHEDVVGYRDTLPQYGGSRPLTISRYDPVLPQLGFRAGKVNLRISKEGLADFSEEIIFWEIYADNSPIETGVIKISDLFGTD